MSFPSGKYNIIYADPGWQYDNKRTGGSLKSGAGQKYTVMSIAEICSLPVRDIAEKDSVLFLWATVPMLPEAMQVLAAWGYKYKTAITWHKTGRLGLGYWFRGVTEILLLGVRGKVKAFRCQIPNLVAGPVLSHSEKPEQFRTMIELATTGAIMEPKRIELFARRQVPGWDSWGNEIQREVGV